MTTKTHVKWDEPAGCTTPRGWLMIDGTCRGNYLDYGPEHYRSPHSAMLNTINGMREVVWCQLGHLCPTCQPGNVHAIRYPDGPSSNGGRHDSRYCETVADARSWIETGRS